jgi:hypothetical protein
MYYFDSYHKPMKAYRYDLFISHAFEDKNDFTDELALELKKQGVRAWYSGFELTLGTSITSSINQALIESKYGLVIISPMYLKKQWAMKELEAFFASEQDHKRILPVLHKITPNELREKLPVFADRYAVASSIGIPNIIGYILEAIAGIHKQVSENLAAQKKTKRKKKKKQTTPQVNAGINITNSNNLTIGNAAGGNINTNNIR